MKLPHVADVERFAFLMETALEFQHQRISIILEEAFKEIDNARLVEKNMKKHDKLVLEMQEWFLKRTNIELFWLKTSLKTHQQNMMFLGLDDETGNNK